MSWWGKLVGGAFGFLLGGGSPLGAILGAALGHQFDQGFGRVMNDEQFGEGAAERVQAAFFTATFSVMGFLAKADGRVSKDEIDAARHIMDQMQLSEEQKELAINLFYEGKKSGFDFDSVLEDFRRECHRRRNLIRMFIEIQLAMAMADGVMHPAEKDALAHMCDVLGFSRAEFELLLRMVQGQQSYQSYYEEQAESGRYRETAQRQPDIREAYAVLGVDASTSDKDIKRAYKRLMSQHHPDKLVAKGLPEEMMKMATEKTQEIRAAYEQVKTARGMK
jgi:DnaJ like chaperone protein